ncbi:MAG: phosphonoacetaldehyde hydrolase, partial [Actinobacteria bacterium]|nr:phosphonoacetaldehyde hydrolase [Actinomycetota bacterium]MBT6211976.1 phosphonoacetaldehyde hydrolase [Actinomycetota bacterium]MBT6943835.1 phosphonoacetaldehyde hydrolase [Actinomycetota bacterium]
MERPAARSYRGSVRGVVLDWSGTTVDAYVIAPAIVFVEV